MLRNYCSQYSTEEMKNGMHVISLYITYLDEEKHLHVNRIILQFACQKNQE